MIKVFGQNDTSFDSNGDVVIKPIRAKVNKADNGDYYLDLECGLEYVDLIVEDRIIVANTPQGEQAFRIKNPEKTKTKVSCKAWHVFYDSKGYVIADTFIVDKDCADALAQLNANIDATSPFSTLSDVPDINSYRCVRTSLYDAISTVLERWGGHLVRNNFSIQILSSIGQDNGVTVRYRKNLKDISCEENWNDVVTKILPVGRDGILLNALDPSESIYIVSSTQYNVAYTKVVEFEQELESEDYPSEADYKQALVDDLRAQATAYLNENCIPKVNYTLKANMEKITDIGDTVEVIDERLGINITTHVIGFTYDCILEAYTEIEFGNFQRSLSDLVGTITAQTSANTIQVVQKATDSIWNTLENSYTIIDGNQILIVDTLPKESATNVIKLDSQGIQFGNHGISGAFSTSWAIDGTFKPKNGEAMSDYVIDEGTSGIWKYKKWSSGLVELDGIDTITSLTSWTSLVSGLYYKTRAVAYPFNVTDAIITANIGTDAQVSWIANAKADSVSQILLTVVRNSTSGGFTINIHVVGSWR